MIPIVWHGSELRVSRLVLPVEGWTAYEQAIEKLAKSYGLMVDTEKSLPQSGDFWLGCRPKFVLERRLDNIGFAAAQEVPVAILGLLAAQHGYPSAPTEEWDLDLDECLLTEAYA